MDNYSGIVFRRLSEAKTGEVATRGLDEYQRVVFHFFRALFERPAQVSPAEMNAILKRCEELIDRGVCVGSRAADLVRTLREVHESLVGELHKTLRPRPTDVLNVHVNLRDAIRSPALRAALSRRAERMAEHAGLWGLLRAAFLGDDRGGD